MITLTASERNVLARATRPDTHTIALLWKGFYELALQCGFTYDSEAARWIIPASPAITEKGRGLTAPSGQ